MKRIVRLRSAIFILVILAQMPAVSHGGECLAGDAWYLPRQGSLVQGDDWLASVAGKSVILIGEHHDNPAHHRWQLTVLNTLLLKWNKNGLPVVGFEMLPRSRQPVLDRWFRSGDGKEILRRESQWEAVWGFEFDYYYPLMALARDQAGGVLALNAEAELVAQVRSSGWEQASAALRQGLRTPAPPSREYLRLLASSFLGHVPPDGASADDQKQRFLRFVQGQQVWDSVMAQTIAQYRERNPETGVIAFMGSWHLIDGGGVPYQLAQLGVTGVAVIVPWDAHLDCAGMNPGYADAVYGLDYRQ